MKKNNTRKDVLTSLAFFVLFSLFYMGTKMIFSSIDVTTDYNGPSQSLFNLRIPKDLHFAGEPIPRNDYSIKENMENVLHGGNFEKSTVFVLFSRASSWFPLIERILKRNNIPEDFKYVALAESRLTNSTSPQGAVGFWQFVSATGSHYGLEIDSEVDERYSVEKSTEAACRYFKDAYRKFKNWTLVAASYNLGMGGVEAHMKKQATGNYYDLMMNRETSLYIYRVLALKTVFMNSGKKFMGGVNIYNTPGLIFKTDSSIADLDAFAKSKGCSVEILKTLNPWLVGNSLLNAGKKTYSIKLPGKDYLKKFAILRTDTVQMKQDTLPVKALAPDTLSALPDTGKENKK